MRGKHNESVLEFFCVGCKRERVQSYPAKIGSPKFFFQILIATAFLSLIFWPWLHFKGLFAFVIPVGLSMEALYRMKMRAALVCPDCRFDPILFLSDQKKAIAQVEEAWKKKFAEKGFPYPERKRTKKTS